MSAALRVDSIPAQAFAKALHEFEVCVSISTFAELDRVMRRKKFNAYRPLEERLAFVELYREKSACHESKEVVFDCRDPNDNKFLELALSVGAEIIVSSDPDLHILNPYRNIAILKPSEFLNVVT